MEIPLSWYLVFAAALFAIGLYGVLARKNAIAILMGIELMLNAVNVNLLAFWRYKAQALKMVKRSSPSFLLLRRQKLLWDWP
jgi:NADH:ubiquinone oxidoreductase subunit K